MEDNTANSLEQEASENLNIDEQTPKNTNQNQDQAKPDSLNCTISNIDQIPQFNDSSPQTQIQPIKSVEFQTKSLNPTVLVELNDDDNEESCHNQMINTDNFESDQNNNNNFLNKEDNSDQNIVNRFILSNLSQGKSFISDDTPSFASNTEIQSNSDIVATNDNQNHILIHQIIPELRRSGQNDLNLLESKTPSNVTTEENSPKSRPFSPDIQNSPGSPPHIENAGQDIKSNEQQFKTLLINGDDEESTNNEQQTQNSQDDIYKDDNEHRANQIENHSQIENNYSTQTSINQPIVLRLSSNPYQNEYSGLQNQGATCYMNSMLQALYHLPIFRRFIYKMDYSEAASDEQNIPLNLQRLFAMMQLRIRSAIPTKELTNSFGWTAHQTYTQHDVQEFCRVILDNIESKMKKQENLKDAIGYLFRGKMRSEIKLKTNEVENSTTEEFYDLSMVVKDTNSLEESFQKYIEPEVIPDYDTETGKQEITKTLEFVQFPPVLYIHLRRFEYDPETQNMKKINSRFEFPETIDLSQFLVEDENNDQDECQIFDLFGVLVHNGGSYSGHYFAYLRPCGDEDRWFLFNDSNVTEVRKEEAIQSNYGGMSDQSSFFERSYSAYMLIYIRRSRIPEFYEKVTDSEIPESAAKYAQEKKEKYERQLEEKRRIENTISFKLFGDEDLRKNALNCSISFIFHRNKLLNVDVMKYDIADDLYEKVAKLIKIRKFLLYEVDSMSTFEEINRDSSSLLQSLYCKYIYIYTNFKENRIFINRQKYRNRHNHHHHHQHQNFNITDQNDNINDENEDEGNVNYNNEDEQNEIIINNEDAQNIKNENENKVIGLHYEEEEKIIDNDNNNEEDFNDIKKDNNRNSQENNNEYEYANEEEEEEDKNEEEDEEDDDEDEENNSNYGLFPDENSIALVFYFIFIQNQRKYPIRFWKADRIKTKWKASRIYNKCEKIFKVYPSRIYHKILYNEKYKYVDPECRLDFIKNGMILVVEIDNSYLPPMIRFNDNRILQMNEEEEEEEDEDTVFNYLDKYPLKSFQEYLSYYPRQITFKLTVEKSCRLIKVPYKIPNDKFIKFVKNQFKISKNLFLVFYDEKSKTPYDIAPNQNSLDTALKGPDNVALFAYPVSQMMSYNLFKNNYRILFFTGNGYFQSRFKKCCFVSCEAKVQDLIDYKLDSSVKKVENRLITIYDNKIIINDPDDYISDLRGRIRVEEVPEEKGDAYVQLMISKDVANYLEIFNNSKGKSSRKIKYTRSIECLFPIIENEMFPDTKIRIIETFRCNESKMCNISFQIQNPNSYNRYIHTLADIDTIFELIEIDTQYYFILSLEKIQCNDDFDISLPIPMHARNQDSIYIQN